MKYIGTTFFAGLFLTLLVSFSFPEKQTLHRIYPKGNVEWMTMEEAINKAEKAPRKLFIDIYTDWCGWCKRMDAATFQQPYIAAYLNANYYPVKFNAEQKTDILFKDKNYVFVDNGKRGYHELAAAITKGRLSYPTVAFLDEKMEVIQAINGYKDPLDFEQIMTYFGGNNHKKTPWEKYKKTYKSLKDGGR